MKTFKSKTIPLIVLDGSTEAASETRIKASKKDDRSKDNPVKFSCDVCNVHVPSAKHLEDHFNGRKHKNKSKKVQRKSDRLSNQSESRFGPNPESLLGSYPGESGSAEAEMNSSNRNSRRKCHKNGFFPDSYHGPNPHDNFGQYQGNRNWNNNWQHWRNAPWNYQSEGYHPYGERNCGFDPRFMGFGPNGSQPNYHQQYEDWVQNPECDVSKCDSDVQVESEDHPTEMGASAENGKIVSGNSTDAKTDSGVQKTKAKNSPATTSQNSLAKRVAAKKQSSPARSGDKSSDSEKQGEKRCILTENMTDRIAHWINPSNPKDKAEVMKLVTEFSKSKKKENLLKLKLQTNSISNENNCDRKDETSCSSSSPSGGTNDTHSSVLSPDNLGRNNATSRRKRRTKSETLQQDGNINPFISGESSGSGSASQRNGLRKPKSTVVEPPSKKIRRRSLCNSVDENRLSENAQVLNEVAAEKKRKEQNNGTSKQHKCSTAECLESCINDVIEKGIIACAEESIENVSQSPAPPSVKTSTPVAPNVSTCNPPEPVSKIPVKQEIMDFEGYSASNMQLPPCILEAFSLQDHTNKELNSELNQSDGATMTPVESLIDLFASGNIRVKKEFDDPIIDVIRTVDPEILNRVCEGQFPPTAQNTTLENCNAQESIPSTELPLVKDALASIQDDTVQCDTTDTDDTPDSLPFLKTSFKNILNEIQSISLLEEKVKENLQQADSKIQEYQALVDEWKTKKIKIQSEEETLRKQRNNLVRTMADLVTQYNFEQNTVKQTSTSNSPTLNGDISAPSTSSQNKKPAPHSRKKASASKVEETEDIAILPPPIKSNDIPLIDLEEFDSPDEIPSVQENGWSSDTDAMIERFSKLKNIAAHSVTVNCIQFFEDHLYTCSSDYTARRFSLKDSTKTITYQHPKRNVSQLCVEKVRGLTLVFTICSGSKIVSSFKAVDGVLFRTFTLNYPVASICKSKGLIYGGLRNGSIVACNWKDHKEIVNISEPIRSIDSTYQGRLNILVTLSIAGNVSIRDADRNGLLIRYVKARSYVPLFMTVCSDSIYLSSAGVLTVLDIESGTYLTKYSFSAAYTSLAVYRDSIFTASFSGLVRCYSKDEEKPVKMYYGAGGTAITCINVYHGWVFTGNKHGAVSVFKYDPNSVHPCKFGKCDFLFPRIEDLEFHALLGKDHDLPAVGAACTWRKCPFIIPYNWDIEAIKAHIKSHLL